MISVAGYPVQSASGEFHSCLPRPGKARFLLAGGGTAGCGTDWEGWGGCSSCAEPCAPALGSVGALLRLCAPTVTPDAFKGVCFSYGQAPAWCVCLGVIPPGGVWRLPCCHLQWVSACVWLGPAPGQCPDPLPDHLTS